MQIRQQLTRGIALLVTLVVLPLQAADKPNIMVLWGDDIGITNISAYSDGIMGYRTPNSLPGSEMGLQDRDITIAEMLKTHGYSTGQFGKNHLGDKDEFLPTNHGFDEFFGNLYHLNAEEEPEDPDYPKDPAFRKQFGPRGVIHSYADGRIEDTGPLTRKTKQ